MNKDYTVNDYRKIFEMAIDSNIEIRTQDGKDQLVIADNEKWSPCYKQGDKKREQLPKYWFISDKGNLVSCQSGKAMLLKKDNDNGRYSYHFHITIDDNTVTKNIECHNLVWLVFGGLSYGKAEELLEEQGIFAFGRKNSEEIKLNGHHVGDKEDNSPDNVELVTTPAHIIIDKVPKNSDSNKVNDFLMEFGKMAVAEEPSKISILLTGQKLNKDTLEIESDNGFRCLYGTDKVTLSKKAIYQLLTMQNGYKSKWLIDKATELILKTYGIDFFTEPKYLCTKEMEFYKCEKIGEELVITDINNMGEIIDKHLIMCYLNSDNVAEVYIDKQEETA